MHHTTPHHNHKMNSLLHELLENNKKNIEKNTKCSNCGCDADEQYTRYIFWHKYTFCGGWCQYDTERSIRKNSMSIKSKASPKTIKIGTK